MEISTPSAKPAVVREIVALGPRVSCARVALVASFEGRLPLAPSGQLGVSDITMVSPPPSHQATCCQSAGVTTTTAPAGHNSALTEASLPSAGGEPVPKQPRNKAPSAAVLCTRLSAPPGEASTSDIQYTLAHLKKQHNDYINNHGDYFCPRSECTPATLAQMFGVLIDPVRSVSLSLSLSHTLSHALALSLALSLSHSDHFQVFLYAVVCCTLQSRSSSLLERTAMEHFALTRILGLPYRLAMGPGLTSNHVHQ